MKIVNRNRQTNPLYNKVYQLWYNMIQRCHNKNHPRYKDYGGKGVFVNERWRELDNFIEDIDKIEGFSVSDLLDGKIQLDKEAKDKNNKEYCLESVAFVSAESNNRRKPNQQKPFTAISPEGKVYEAYNQSEFARLHGLRQNGISACLTGRSTSHKGWKFTYKN